MRSKPHFVLVGHEGCHNRGCEALVRTAIDVLREQWPNASFSVVSSYPEHDAPLAKLDNVLVFPATGVLASLLTASPHESRLHRARRLAGRAVGAICPALARRITRPHPEPRPVREEQFARTQHLKSLFESATAVISVGGDIFIEDYGPPLLGLEQVELAQYLGIQTIIWGASIWPLKTDWVEERTRAMLAGCALVTVRDESSARYLESLGIRDNVALVADGALLMAPDRASGNVIEIPDNASWLIGLNGSSLMSSYLCRHDCGRVLQEMKAFFDKVLSDQHAAMVLIPHDGPPGAREREFLYEFRQMLQHKDRAFLIPAGLDAPRTKYYIGCLDVFVAMRFHPSVAALSQGVPTLGLAHSPKFQGLHQMIFGHTDYVLPYREISADALWAKVALLRTEASAIRAHLHRRIPELQALARSAGAHARTRLTDAVPSLP